MITTHFYKAQPVTDRPVESVTIVIEHELPEFKLATDQPLNGQLRDYQDRYYKPQAEELAQLLLKALPGGTFDQLLCAMLQVKASHFSVAFGAKE